MRILVRWILCVLVAVLTASAEGQSTLWVLKGPDVPTERVNGILLLPPPLDPTDFVVGNMFDDQIPNEEGRFDLLIRQEGVTVTAAVPRDYEDGENVWLAVTARVPGAPRGTNPEIVIDADSTARGLVAMHPYVLSPDPFKMDFVLGTVELLPEVELLAADVLADYPTVSFPLENPDFLLSYIDAVAALIDTLPANAVAETGATRSLKASETPQIERRQIVRTAGPRIEIRQLDGLRELRWSSPSADKLEILADIGNPLDTYVTLRQVDPSAIHFIMEGTAQVGTFVLNDLIDARDRRNDPPEYPFFTRKGSDVSVTAVAPRSLFKYVDLFGLLLDLLSSAIGLGAEPSLLTLGTDEDALYVIRGINGRFASGFDEGEFGFAWNNFRQEYVNGLSLNILNGTLEFIAIFVDLRELIGSCVVKVFFDISQAVQDNLGTAVITEQPPESILPLMSAVAKAAGESALTCAKDALADLVAKKPLKGLMAVGKSLFKTIDILGKVSRVGSFWERITSLTGFPFGIATTFITPMTTGLVIVGDPFGPRITSINGVDPATQGTPLTSVATGGELIIEGHRFQRLPGDPLPTVLVTDGDGRQRKLTVQTENFEPGLGGDPPLQRITLTVPFKIAGDLKISVLSISGQTETPPILTVRPTLDAVDPESSFPSLAGQAIRLHGDGFRPSDHSVVFDSGSDQTLAPPITDEGESNVSRLEFSVPTGLAPGVYELKVRWRDPSEDAAGTPPIDFIVLGLPVIDAFSPGSVRPDQIVRIDGRNFGDQTAPVTVNFEVAHIGVISTSTPILVEPTGTTPPDQNAFLWVRPMLSYDDPVPGTEVLEPMTVETTITTPEGTSAISTFTIETDAEPEFTRSLTYPFLSLQEQVDYANQDPEPAGSIETSVVCEVPNTCDGNPVLDGHCVVEFPDSYIPIPDPIFSGHIGTSGVSPPPGRPLALGMVCNPCDTTGPIGCPEEEGPITWEGIPASNIRDTLEFVPDSENAGDISLSSVLPGTVLTGPDVLLDVSATPNAFGRFVGGGFVIEGDGMDGTDLRIGMIGTWDIFEGEGTVITIRNARGVHIRVDIEGTPADVGVLIENSRDIKLFGRIKDCVNGVIVRDSENVELGMEISGCETGIMLNGGGFHKVMSSQLGYRLADDGLSITVGEGQLTGLLLTGGTVGNQVIDVEMLGLQAGIRLDDCEDNLIEPRSVGCYVDFANSEIAVADGKGTSTGNNVGIMISNGAVNNIVRSSSFIGFPTLVGNNDFGVLVDGGSGNVVQNFAVGFSAAPDTITVPPEGIGNDVGILVEGDALDTLVTNNVFADNVTYGLQLDALTESNDVQGNFFATQPEFPGPGFTDRPANGTAGLAVTGTFTTQRVATNFFDGETIAVFVENSANIDFRRNIIQNVGETGIIIAQSAGITFEGERICGGSLDREGLCDTSTKGGLFGISNVASGGTRMADLVILGIDGAGLEFRQPPVVGGPVRVESPVDQGSVVPSPLRDDPFDPLNPVPLDRVSGGRSVVVAENSGHGVVVADGATDIALIGLDIHHNGEHGVALDGAGSDIRIAECLIAMNFLDGVHIKNATAGSTFVGTPGHGNMVVENGGWGLVANASSGVFVQGNNFGGNGTGGALASDGVLLNGCNDVLVGGSESGAPNLISDNERDGVRVIGFSGFPAPAIAIEGNFIGTGSDGTSAAGNGGYGMRLIGGTGARPDARIILTNNLIGANVSGGLHLEDWGTNLGPVADGNLIGLWPRDEVLRGSGAGDIGVANGGPGIELTSAGNAIVQRNKIGSNVGDGIALTDSSSNLLRSNELSDNGGAGIRADLGSSDNLVEFNTVTGSGSDGVRVESGSVRNSIFRNSLASNGGLGILLASGGNFGISEPVMQSITRHSNGHYSVRGAIPNFVPDGSRVELFADETDEARLFLSVDFTINRQFSFFDVPPPPGETLDGKTFRATVTDLNGNTSELGEEGTDPPDRNPPLCPNLPGTSFDVLVASERAGDIALTNVATCDTSTTQSSPQLESRPSALALGKFARLAFATERDGNSEIYLSDELTSPVQRLTTNALFDGQPALNRTGDRVAFVSERDGNRELYAMDRDGGNVVRMTNDSADDAHPTFSSDGATIAFASNRSGSWQIYTIDAAGGNLQQRTSFEGDATDPEWHPTGGKIAFQFRAAGAPAQIGLLSVADGSVGLVPNNGWSDEQPTWLVTSDDEDYLVVASRPDAAELYHLYLMSPQGYLLWQITPVDEEDRNPSCCLPAED